MSENTIYDERTRFQSNDDEATRFENSQTSKPEETKGSEQKSKTSAWKSVASGLGTGVLLGSVATLFTSGTSSELIDGDADGETGGVVSGGSTSEQHPPLTDGNVDVSESVTDDMSFSEAFAAARAEVGPGGVFEWHGNVYSTYTSEEWESMSTEQKDEYTNHLNIDTNSTTVEQVADEQGQHETVDVSPQEVPEEVEVINQEEPEVEVLGVVHDDETGANVGAMLVDNQEVVVVDVEGDGAFDVLAADSNGDGQIANNELVDISGSGLTVDDLGGVTPDEGSTMAYSETVYPDYTNDMEVYEG